MEETGVKHNQYNWSQHLIKGDPKIVQERIEYLNALKTAQLTGLIDKWMQKINSKGLAEQRGDNNSNEKAKRPIQSTNQLSNKSEQLIKFNQGLDQTIKHQIHILLIFHKHCQTSYDCLIKLRNQNLEKCLNWLRSTFRQKTKQLEDLARLSKNSLVNQLSNQGTNQQPGRWSQSLLESYLRAFLLVKLCLKFGAIQDCSDKLDTIRSAVEDKLREIIDAYSYRKKAELLYEYHLIVVHFEMFLHEEKGNGLEKECERVLSTIQTEDQCFAGLIGQYWLTQLYFFLDMLKLSMREQKYDFESNSIKQYESLNGKHRTIKYMQSAEKSLVAFKNSKPAQQCFTKKLEETLSGCKLYLTLYYKEKIMNSFKNHQYCFGKKLLKIFSESFKSEIQSMEEFEKTEQNLIAYFINNNVSVELTEETMTEQASYFYDQTKNINVVRKCIQYYKKKNITLDCKTNWLKQFLESSVVVKGTASQFNPEIELTQYLNSSIELYEQIKKDLTKEQTSSISQKEFELFHAKCKVYLIKQQSKISQGLIQGPATVRGLCQQLAVIVGDFCKFTEKAAMYMSELKGSITPFATRYYRFLKTYIQKFFEACCNYFSQQLPKKMGNQIRLFILNTCRQNGTESKQNNPFKLLLDTNKHYRSSVFKYLDFIQSAKCESQYFIEPWIVTVFRLKFIIRSIFTAIPRDNNEILSCLQQINDFQDYLDECCGHQKNQSNCPLNKELLQVTLQSSIEKSVLKLRQVIMKDNSKSQCRPLSLLKRIFGTCQSRCSLPSFVLKAIIQCCSQWETVVNGNPGSHDKEVLNRSKKKLMILRIFVESMRQCLIQKQVANNFHQDECNKMGKKVSFNFTVKQLLRKAHLKSLLKQPFDIKPFDIKQENEVKQLLMELDFFKNLSLDKLYNKELNQTLLNIWHMHWNLAAIWTSQLIKKIQSLEQLSETIIVENVTTTFFTSELEKISSQCREYLQNVTQDKTKCLPSAIIVNKFKVFKYFYAASYDQVVQNIKLNYKSIECNNKIQDVKSLVKEITQKAILASILPELTLRFKNQTQVLSKSNQLAEIKRELYKGTQQLKTKFTTEFSCLGVYEEQQNIDDIIEIQFQCSNMQLLETQKLLREQSACQKILSNKPIEPEQLLFSLIILWTSANDSNYLQLNTKQIQEIKSVCLKNCSTAVVSNVKVLAICSTFRALRGYEVIICNKNGYPSIQQERVFKVFMINLKVCVTWITPDMLGSLYAGLQSIRHQITKLLDLPATQKLVWTPIPQNSTNKNKFFISTIHETQVISLKSKIQNDLIASWIKQLYDRAVEQIGFYNLLEHSSSDLYKILAQTSHTCKSFIKIQSQVHSPLSNLLLIACKNELLRSSGQQLLHNSIFTPVAFDYLNMKASLQIVFVKTKFVDICSSIINQDHNIFQGDNCEKVLATLIELNRSEAIQDLRLK